LPPVYWPVGFAGRVDWPKQDTGSTGYSQSEWSGHAGRMPDVVILPQWQTTDRQFMSVWQQYIQRAPRLTSDHFHSFVDRWCAVSLVILSLNKKGAEAFNPCVAVSKILEFWRQFKRKAAVFKLTLADRYYFDLKPSMYCIKWLFCCRSYTLFCTRRLPFSNEGWKSNI
jgi:hypothetical protein